MRTRRSPSRDPRVRPPEIAEILPNLYLGEYPRPEDVDGLRRSEVTAVLSLQDDDDLAAKGLDLGALLEAYRQAGIELHRLPVADNDPDALAVALPHLLDRLHDLLQRGHTVLLHCNAGYNRSPTVVIGYLHRRGSMTLDEARAYVRERRACLPFMTALRRFFG